MFLRSISVNGHEYLVLVENYRQAGRVKQRVLRSFGRRDRVNLADVRQVLAQIPGFAFFKNECNSSDRF